MSQGEYSKCRSVAFMVQIAYSVLYVKKKNTGTLKNNNGVEDMSPGEDMSSYIKHKEAVSSTFATTYYIKHFVLLVTE